MTGNKNRLIRERESNPLNLDTLTTFLHGGQESEALYRKALKIVSQESIFLESDYNFYDLSREEKRKLTLERIERLHEILLSDGFADQKLFRMIIKVIGQFDASTTVRFGVNFGLFLGAVMGQGSAEQASVYAPKVFSGEIFGCFCMTELGTGSYLQSLETTATYLSDSDEFEIHTPTLTATKWWIGAASQSATHAIVFAKLILKGEDIGTHNFIVQLRDKNFDILDGISIGDVGAKRGDNGIDNGWVKFNHVRIARDQMLSKWSRVNEKGEYEKSELKQLSYGALISGRVNIAAGCNHNVERAVTIALRYCTVRNQFSMKGKSLLDYTVAQERLIGSMCAAYAFHFATHRLGHFYEKVTAELENKDISNLKDLHNVAAGLKGLVALWANDAINQCIFSMGGHSYSKLSGLPDILADFAPSIPYEGDAIVMIQQTARYLVKSAGVAMQGEEITAESILYLNDISALDEMKCNANQDDDLSLSDLRDASKWLAMTLVREAAIELQSEINAGKDGDEVEQEAWNICQLTLIQASRAHILYAVINTFYDVIENELPQALGDSAESLLPLLNQVAILFAARHVQDFMSTTLEHEYFPATRAKQLRQQILGCYRTIRPFANQLVDAWDIPDFMLLTPLGRADGEIYENYFKAVNDTMQDIKPEYRKYYLKPKLKMHPTKKKAA